MTRTKLHVTILAIIALTGCAELNAIAESAAQAKKSLNDQQARIWALSSCDISLGGMDQLPPDLRNAVMSHCLGLPVESERVTIREVSPALRGALLNATPANVEPVDLEDLQ